MSPSPDDEAPIFRARFRPCCGSIDAVPELERSLANPIAIIRAGHKQMLKGRVTAAAFLMSKYRN